jgi:hypothetical protein
METTNPAMIWTTVLAIASAFVLLATAAEKAVGIWKKAKEPNDKQDKRLDDLEEWRREVDKKLTSDHSHLSVIDDGNRVTQRALLALLDHGIDGNNIAQMQQAKAELQDHLINR